MGGGVRKLMIFREKERLYTRILRQKIPILVNLHCCGQILSRNSLGEEGFIMAQRFCNSKRGRIWLNLPGTRKPTQGSLLTFFLPFNSSRHPAFGMVSPILMAGPRYGVPFNWSPMEEKPYREGPCAHLCVPGSA